MGGDEEPEPSGSPRGALIGLLVVVALVVGVLFVMQRLHHAASLQDCVASGRTNCAPIEAPAR
ncbi:MAG TPA: hypothetical protein VN702_07670 [Acetobacteraceae bacterium]|nr:hypothetical protein [Acetobacteraceae bacterium]